ncbi:cyclic nucleotide-binding domain-containing protein, partial [candidate division KSB1 bacterium]|nr:cyclic nucleotide-binding domain-containing protein [candidate division KSB1 bacterium]
MDKFLEKVQLFKDLSNDELEQLSKLVSTEAVPASTLLFEENSTREALFIVKQGEILLSKKSLYGTEKRLNVFRKYDFFGESALFDQSPRTTSARALTDAIYLRIQRTDFLTFLQKNPSVAAKIYLRISRVITRRMQSTSTLLANEAAQYASGRVRSEYDMLGSRDIPH